MIEVLKQLYRGVLRRLPIKLACYLIYFRGYKKILNLKEPQYFGEKIQWLKLYGHLEELAPYVDKYEVRNFVSETIGKKYLNKLYGVYDKVDDVNFELLPQKFVLKCTNGSGSVLICKDKSKLNIFKVKREMQKWLDDDFSKMKKEPQYKNIKNRIIAEQYLEDESGELRDYKFYCFDGKPRYYSIFSHRFTKETTDTYDMNGNKLNVINGCSKQSSEVIILQNKFDELCLITKELAKKFQFVRVDYYIVNCKIYFGELTFTDGAGSDPFFPRSFDLEMGKRIKLGRVLR